jgi:hypothetical protein
MRCFSEDGEARGPVKTTTATRERSKKIEAREPPWHLAAVD